MATWNHCTTIGAGRALSLRSSVSFAAKTSHPPKLQSPRSGSNQQPVFSIQWRTCRFPHRVLANSHGVRHHRFGLVSGTFCQSELGVRHPDLLWCQTPIEQLRCGPKWQIERREERGRRGEGVGSFDRINRIEGREDFNTKITKNTETQSIYGKGAAVFSNAKPQGARSTRRTAVACGAERGGKGEEGTRRAFFTFFVWLCVLCG